MWAQLSQGLLLRSRGGAGQLWPLASPRAAAAALPGPSVVRGAAQGGLVAYLDGGDALGCTGAAHRQLLGALQCWAGEMPQSYILRWLHRAHKLEGTCFRLRSPSRKTLQESAPVRTIDGRPDDASEASALPLNPFPLPSQLCGVQLNSQRLTVEASQ